MQPTFPKKPLILSIIFFIFSGLVFIFLLREINNKREISQLAEEKWQTETLRRENTKALLNSIKIVEPQRLLLDTHFVQSSDIVPFLDTIEKIAKNVGAKTEITSVDIAKDNSSLIVEINALGSFETIYKLILLLENFPYNLEFISVDIKNLDMDINKNPQWVANFQIKLLNFIK